MAATTLGGHLLLCLVAAVAATDAALSGGNPEAAVASEPSAPKLPACRAEGGCEAEDDPTPAFVGLLQMGLSIGDATLLEANKSAAGTGMLNKSVLNMHMMKVNASAVAAKIPPCLAEPTPLQLQSQIGLLDSFGYQARRACQNVVVPPTNISHVTYDLRMPGERPEEELTKPKEKGILASIPLALWFLGAYVLLMMFTMLRLLWTISRPGSVVQPKNADYRPESEAYRAGLTSWLTISWVTPWIVKFGNNADPKTTKIKADDLGKTGWADYEATNCCDDFMKIWNEDIAKNGTSYCNMYMVIAKFCTWRKVLQLSAMTFGFEVLMYLGPTICVDWTLNYMEQMQIRQYLHPGSVTIATELPVILAVVCMYTGMPLFMTIFNTVAMLVGSRLSIRLQAGLTAAVYKKAQRMPITGGNYDLRENIEKGMDANPDQDSKETSDQSKSYSLVQLVNTDINANLMQFQFIVAKLIITIPILAGLIGLMALKMGKAAWLPIGLVLVMTRLIMFIIMQQVIRFRWYQVCVGGKLTFFQEVMHAIRMVKSNAYEPAVSQILSDCRTMEVTQLCWFFFWMGVDIAVVFIYPKLVILSGLACYERLHKNEIHASDIFVMMQLLGAFKGCAQTFLGLLPALVGFSPSLRRLDKMLKLKEASLAGSKTEHAGKTWLTVWPKENPKKPLALTNETEPCLRVQGSFLWSEHGATALSDLDFRVTKGELVAVMGEVGSGKSTLLAALLGELTPTQDSRLEIPERIAYHSQVPVVTEATLRENVLYWSDFDEKTYQEALRAACLLPDLEVLPGGDAVPIGSRGISLSGGQRARVSLARAAYATYAPVVLIDDPFASVDAPTGRHIMDNLLLGPLMQDRARVVVCQPDRQRVKAFHRVVIMSEGRIVVSGTPEEVVSNEHYQALLSKFEANQLREDIDAGLVANQEGSGGYERTVNQNDAGKAKAEACALREEEHEGRADAGTIHFFLALGGYKLLIMSFVFFLVFVVFGLFSDLVLVRWSNRIMQNEALGIKPPSCLLYLGGSCIWFAIALGAYAFHWICGCSWSVNISRDIYGLVLNRLMRAPVDKFYDKTPVGRIMNRMSFDMTDIDLQMYGKFQGIIGQVISYGVPLVYVHWVMPVYLLLGSIPFYCLLWILVSRYWNTMVPLRYLNATTRSELNAYITEVENGSISSRAYQVSDIIAAKQMESADEMIKASWANSCVSRWTTNRVLLTYSVFGTVVAAIGIIVLARRSASVGTVGLCLSHISAMIMGSEGFLGMLTEAQFQFISMNRLEEYTRLPEEREPTQPTDGKYNSPVVTVQRSNLGSCEVRREGTRLQILRHTGPNGEMEVVLEQMLDAQAFQPPAGKNMATIDPTNPVLYGTTDWHRVFAVNGISKDAAAMAEEFCNGNMATVWLSIRSGWLDGGARVVMTDLVIGYADMPNDVLRGVNLTIEPKSKTAIAGATGCGKSTTILAILRMLEPRGGRVEINGVDLQGIGLQTLRNSMGLVPQDPVLFSGTIRNNLDPFSLYTDPEVWNALRSVQMAEFVVKHGVGLDMYIKADGDNLSFGQKQLMCIARQVLRSPELLLLDECTSAIDPHTQELVQDTIRSGFPDATLVAIAHRLETIMDFDTVIVLDKGRVVEKGAISELSDAKGGWFSKMLHAKDR